MRFSNGLARVAVRRPYVLVAAALLLAGASLAVIRSHQSFDSEILNLLPGESPAVQGLKIYNARFNSARELAFLVEGGDPGAAADFVESLSAQPWVLRVLDAPPMESGDGRATLPRLAAPILMGQSEEAFERTLDRLDRERVKARIATLVRRAAAGSPLALVELENDPTGVIGPLAGELSTKLRMEDAFRLSSGDARIVPVITRQPDLSADACSELMEQVRGFLRGQSARPGAPRVSVTGRSAYVDEISRSMRTDIFWTSLVSVVAVTGLFWISFRSLVPLIGSVLILGWSCLVSLAVGALVFESLNVVAMGFCSILVGLGVDFSLLLYQRYTVARAGGAGREQAIADSLRHATPGIFWAALTTSLGFAALVMSGSAGFAQLGVLIAVGVAAGGVGMVFLMPLFERGGPAGRRDPVLALCGGLARSRRVGVMALGVFLVAGATAVSPWRALEFDTSTHSLEPRNIPAARALARIMEKFPDTFEPLMVVIPGAASPSDLAALDEVLGRLEAGGRIQRFSSPSALVPDPKQVARNAARLRALDIEGLRREIDAAARQAGLRDGAMDSADALLRAMESGEALQDSLPATSPWWFVLDRMIAPGTGDVISYVRLPGGVGRDERHVVEHAIMDAVPSALVTGWSQMLNDLVPWARRELLLFGGSVVAMILLTLAFVYRNVRVFGLHVATLALAIGGTVATLKLAGRPINLLNVLAFPLILAVGVDYGVHLLLTLREPGKVEDTLPSVMKPVLVSALTTIVGFGALTLSGNPSLNGLGFVCATGVAWCLAGTLLILAPAAVRLARSGSGLR